MKRNLYKTLLCLAVAFAGAAFAGCNILEDESDCVQNTLLSFSFKLKGEEKFASDVPSLSVFVFDREGLFVGRWDDYDNTRFNENYRMALPLSEGYYNIIVWGGLDNDIYYVSRRDGSAAFTPVQGVTHMDELNLKTRSETVASLSGDEHRVDYDLTNIFHGSLINYHVVPSSNGEPVEVPLMKDNKVIKLAVKGLPLPTTRAGSVYTQMDTWLEASNGWYTKDNQIDNPCNKYKYMARRYDNDTEWMRTELHTLRMVYGGSDHTMTIWNNETGAGYYSVDLLNDIIRKVSAYSTQAGVDAEDTFDLQLELVMDGDSNLSVKATLNGWNVSTTGTGIQ